MVEKIMNIVSVFRENAFCFDILTDIKIIDEEFWTCICLFACLLMSITTLSITSIKRGTQSVFMSVLLEPGIRPGNNRL